MRFTIILVLGQPSHGISDMHMKVCSWKGTKSWQNKASRLREDEIGVQAGPALGLVTRLSPGLRVLLKSEQLNLQVNLVILRIS